MNALRKEMHAVAKFGVFGVIDHEHCAALLGDGAEGFRQRGGFQLARAQQGHAVGQFGHGDGLDLLRRSGLLFRAGGW